MMNRNVGLAALAILVMAGVACSQDPVSKVARHMDEMVSILEENRNDPEQAGERILAYAQSNAAELQGLARQIRGLKSYYDKNPEKMAEALQQLAPAIERLMKIESENPTLLTHKKVLAALEQLRIPDTAVQTSARPGPTPTDKP